MPKRCEYTESESSCSSRSCRSRPEYVCKSCRRCEQTKHHSKCGCERYYVDKPKYENAECGKGKVILITIN